jgi:hypothetical protein
MPRLLPLLLIALLLAPAGALAVESPLADPGTVIAALQDANPPADLPGNADAEIALATWEDAYGEPLEGTDAAWVLTGSNELPIATVMVFASPDDADAGLGEFRRGSAETTAGDLDAYTIADRGKWICMASDGAVVLIGQAEPTSVDEPEDAVRDRACDALVATHDWLLAAVTGVPTASPAATPDM